MRLTKQVGGSRGCLRAHHCRLLHRAECSTETGSDTTVDPNSPAHGCEHILPGEKHDECLLSTGGHAQALTSTLCRRFLLSVKEYHMLFMSVTPPSSSSFSRFRMRLTAAASFLASSVA